MLSLRPGGSISGRVTDAGGKPVPNTRVSASILGYDYGRRAFLDGPAATTNEDGEYTLKPLGPGDYYVRLDSGPSNTFGVYYPGAIDAELASPVRVYDGQQLSGFDLAMPEVPTFRISGTVIDVPVPGGRIDWFTYMAAGVDDPNRRDYPFLANKARDPGGKFEVEGVPAGSWELLPVIRLDDADSKAGESLPRVYATGRTRIDVLDRDVDNIDIFAGSADVRGRVMIGSAPPVGSSRALPENVRLRLHPQDNLPEFLLAGEPVEQRPDSSGEFLFRAVPPGTYSLQVLPTFTGVYVADIRIGANSIYDQGKFTVGTDPMEPLNVSLSSGAGTIEGFLDESADASSGDYTPPRIVLVPLSAYRRENRQLFQTTTLIGPPGAFTFRNVPPGEYKVIAWRRVPPGNPELNLEFIARYEGLGSSVSVKAGETSRVRVQLIPAGH